MSVNDWDRITEYGLEPTKESAKYKERTPDPREDEIEICLRWLALFGLKRTRINSRLSSYGLKHVVERWTEGQAPSFTMTDRNGREWTQATRYISNGAFIEAAKRAGYRIERCAPLSPNANFDIAILKEPRSEPIRSLRELAHDEESENQ